MDKETHTILFVQPSAEISSRTYTDFEGISDCAHGICKIFEEKLKSSPLGSDSIITYTVNDLFQYIDTFVDICCLVYESRSGTYAPHDKSWIKKMIYLALSGLASDSKIPTSSPSKM